MNEPDPPRLPRLLRKLTLRELGGDRFMADAGTGRARLFGGLVAAQAVIAAGRTAGELALHSLHAYFLRPGRLDTEIRFEVERTRDGRRFSARRVVAHQDGRPIFHLAASFTKLATGIAHADPAPERPGPEALHDWEQVRATLADDTRPRRAFEAFEVRVVEPERDAPGARSAPTRTSWLRLRGVPPEDPLVCTALLVYASDRTLLRAAARPHGVRWTERPPASLDHALWLHKPVDLSDWLLYDSHSPAASAGRGWVVGSFYERSGARVASVAQEGLIDA
ncbi:MAG TPA: acyl-CoA thioesterase domain-containing protein [Myxococcota bacterium]|nr:acyl-CoA thioesterase domain-containing protein [Myxococcota bacterium]